ncbi:uncharacterized protein [Tenebrio molitor]|uniref:uncharacterized protein isoform X2 n=1 Tax=Tenebrio molitor TaxID=7067 RepID=UPI0036248EF2
MEKTGLYLLLLIGATNSLSDIVTLRKENEVLCITQNVTLPTFISPPFLENSTKSLSLLSGEDWSYDNWILTDGSNSVSGPVMDKRWEDFEVIKTNYIAFTSVQSVSLSLHSPVEVQLYVNDYQNLDHMNLKDLKDLKEGWCHISVFLRNNSVYYLLNNKVIKSVDAFNPHEITFKTKNDTFWKIHDYQFIMSEKVTNGKLTTLTLPSPKHSCFLLYVSLCEKCVLTIPELNRIYNSTNEPSFLNSWQMYKLEIEADLDNLSFYRTTTDNSTLGYWGIDLHECPTKDTVVHRINAPEIQGNNYYLCHVLHHEYRMKRQMKQYNKSVNVELCEDQECKYIWGYSDSYHNNRLSQEDYKYACNLCNKFTYKEPTRGLLIGNTTVITTISLIVIFGALIVVIVIVVKSRKNVRNQNINETELHKLQRVNVT